MTKAGPIQRLGSRVLRLMGVTRRHHFDALSAEHGWVVDELERVHRAIARDGDAQQSVGASPATAPDPETAAEELILRRRQLSAALRELEFHARHWELAAGPGARDWQRYRLGFADPAIRPLPLPRSRATRIKMYRDRPLVSGLTARQAFHLEALCLSRLQDATGAAAGHFPRLVAVDSDRCRLTLTEQGHSLDLIDPAFLRRVAARLAKDAGEQLARIVGAMEAARVVHLDPLRDGHNLTVDQDGLISLIDFDIATIDDMPFSAEISARHAQWRRAGGYQTTLRRLREVLDRRIRDLS